MQKNKTEKTGLMEKDKTKETLKDIKKIEDEKNKIFGDDE